MDPPSWLGIILCLIVFFGLEAYVQKYYPAPPPKPPGSAATAATIPPSASTLTAETPGEPAQSTTPGQVTPPPVQETFTTLENDAIKVTLTSLGAAVSEVELKLHHADNGGNVVLNEHAKSNIFALSGWKGAAQLNFTPQENLGNGVTYTAQLPNGLTWKRVYAFGRERENDAGLTGYVRVIFHKIARHLGEPETKPLVYTLDGTA